MNNKSNFRRGSVELLILHLLSQQDYYGYEISTLIREQTDGYLNIPVGSLYPALYKLIDAGYISDYKKQVGRRQVNVYYHWKTVAARICNNFWRIITRLPMRSNRY